MYQKTYWHLILILALKKLLNFYEKFLTYTSILPKELQQKVAS